MEYDLYDDFYEENVFHKIASEKAISPSYLGYFARSSSSEKQNERNFMGVTPLDVAIDFRNWKAVQIFIRADLHNETMVEAIGNLLAGYWHLGSRNFDRFIFQLMAKKGLLSKQECSFLFERAFDGNAWPYIVPFFQSSGRAVENFEKYYHWQVAESTNLRSAALNALITEKCMQKISAGSIFICSDEGLRLNTALLRPYSESNLLSFIFRRRRIVTKEMKKFARSFCGMNYKTIKRMLDMY